MLKTITHMNKRVGTLKMTDVSETFHMYKST